MAGAPPAAQSSPPTPSSFPRVTGARVFHNFGVVAAVARCGRGDDDDNVALRSSGEGGKELSLTGLGGAPRRCGWIEGNWTDYGRTACTVVVGSASSGFGLEWMDDRSVKTLEAEASRVSEVLRGLV